jgi:hypothetical protein
MHFQNSLVVQYWTDDDWCMLCLIFCYRSHLFGRYIWWCMVLQMQQINK